MQEQISALFMQIETSNQDIKILSNERENLIIRNNILKDENALQIKIFNEYKESHDKEIKEDKNIIKCLLDELARARKEILTLNQIESNAKVNIEAIKIQFENHK